MKSGFSILLYWLFLLLFVAGTFTSCTKSDLLEPGEETEWSLKSGGGDTEITDDGITDDGDDGEEDEEDGRKSEKK